MTAFQSELDIRGSLKDANLMARAEDILATARPALIFVRRQRADDGLPTGTCKLGGLPDLPSGMDWPCRQPFGDASMRGQELRERRQRRRDEEASYDTRSGYDAILNALPEDEREEFLRSIDASRPDPASVAALNAEEDQYDDLRTQSFDRSFPLAFLGQLDLQRLSAEAGFDADLPQTGVLSLFEDITTDDIEESIHLFWFDVTASELVRQSPPDELIALSDARQPYYRWSEQTSAEVLEPHSVITLPFHWAAATGHSHEMYGFLHEPSLGYYPHAEPSEGEQVGYFGDRLGGWPNPIQGDVETEFTGKAGARIDPGDDRIRHLFSWGGEFYHGTRRMNAPYGGDGTTYMMLSRPDLIGRHFDRARALYQCD